MNRQKVNNQTMQDAGKKIASPYGMLSERKLKIIRYRNSRMKNRRKSDQCTRADAMNLYN